MSKPKRILVLTDHMPWGHRSIARAIFNYLKPLEKSENWKVDMAEVRMEMEQLNNIYSFSYRFAPAANKITRHLMKSAILRDWFNEIAMKNLSALKRTVNKFKPDLIICSYYMYSQVLARWRQEENWNFKLWTVVADPWSINPISFVEGADMHLVYDEVGKKLAIKYGIDENKIMVTGWWVRKEMYQKINRLEARRKLGISDERPVIFVGGGSLGNNAVSKVLPVLMFINQKTAFIFNTGTDKLAYNLVDEYSRMYYQVKRGGEVKIINLGWIDNMPEVLAASDIVLGKAGPNFLFDVVACEKPFVSITHIGGQEDGNIDLIRKKHLGWVKEKNGEIGDFLMKYLKSPAGFQQRCSDSIAQEAKRNRKSLEIIVRRLRQEA